jgi:hypothetical protein
MTLKQYGNNLPQELQVQYNQALAMVDKAAQIVGIVATAYRELGREGFKASPRLSEYREFLEQAAQDLKSVERRLPQ